MIYEFQKTYKGTGRPFLTKNVNSFTSITDFFLCEKDLLLTEISLSAIRSEVKNKNIIPLFDCLNFDDKSKDADYEGSEQGFEFKTFDGKYRFEMEFLVKPEYHQLLLNYDYSNLDCFFVDANKNLFIRKSGANYKGFATSMISIEKLKLGSSRNKSFMKIVVEIDEPDEINVNAHVEHLDFNIRKAEVIFCEFTDIEVNGGTVNFNLIDAEFGVPIIARSADDFYIVDDTLGTIAADTHRESFTGWHELTFSTEGTTQAVDNAGATGTTDWTDSNADGLADGWNGLPGQPPSVNYSIVTEAGFTGNVQSIDDNGAFITTLGLISDSISLPVYSTSVFKLVVKSAETITITLTFGDASTIVYTDTPTGAEIFAIDISSKAGLNLTSVEVKAQNYSYDGQFFIDDLRIESTGLNSGVIYLDNENFVGNDNY